MKCPYCRSKNVIKTKMGVRKAGRKVVAGVVFLPLAFAVGNRQKIGECFDCNRQWKL